jgi:cyanophycin synthetase
MSTISTLPDPTTEIRITTLHSTRGINFWSKRPVIRMDLAVGEYDEISSAEADGFTEALLDALPGLKDHHCSIGSRGGFVIRLRRGTYAPHIIEHVALELQSMIGHEVGYGRTRGGDTDGEYTVVFEHRHEQVGLRAAALALETVQRAFAGTLESVDAAINELESIKNTRDTPDVYGHVFCSITGGGPRAQTQSELLRRLGDHGRPTDEIIVDASPAYLLQAGLPYSRSEIAIILDAYPSDVPGRYQEREHARRLVGIVTDAVRRGGTVICPAKEWELQDYAREQDCRVAIFATDDDVTKRDQRVASAVGLVRDDEIWVERCGDPVSAGRLRDDMPAEAQVAAALAEFVSRVDCAD